jgi:hypothetical protein
MKYYLIVVIVSLGVVLEQASAQITIPPSIANVDFFGSDIGYFYNVSSLRSCLNLCDKQVHPSSLNLTCVAWTAVPTSASSFLCYLKHAVSGIRVSAGSKIINFYFEQ